MRGGALLPADEQEVIWIDGLSIELNQLSPELEPVGICVAINGNKAIVRYKEEYDNIKFVNSARWEMDDAYIVELISSGQPVSIKINGYLQSVYLSLTGVSTRLGFVDRLNEYFIANNLNDFSAELVELDTDLPATDTSDEKDGNSYRNRIIVNVKYTDGWFKTITIGTNEGIGAIAKHIKYVEYLLYSNGFDINFGSDPERLAVCKAMLNDFIIPEECYVEPQEQLDSINYYILKDDFENNKNCQIFRDNFASYDDYLYSLLLKVPCGAGEIGENPSGKENTYKLVDCKYTNLNGDKEDLYPAAVKAASIHVNGPKLIKGNWWLPSVAEMVQMMRDITYETSFWDSKPDIVNRVIDKIRKVDTNWTYLSPFMYRWTLSFSYIQYLYSYNGDYGSIYGTDINFGSVSVATPITIYEF